MTFSPYSMNRVQGWAGNYEVIGGESNDADAVNEPDPIYYTMSARWEPIRACLEGTEYLRMHADVFLPQNPLELAESWQGRISRSTFSNYYGKVLRPILPAHESASSNGFCGKNTSACILKYSVPSKQARIGSHLALMV